MKYFNFKYLTGVVTITLSTCAVAFGQQNVPAHYPQKIASRGNAAIDDSLWIAAKKEWIKNYPNEYRSIGGNPNDVLFKVADSSAKPLYFVNIDFNGKQYYKLAKILALDINSKHTPAEMADFSKEAAGDINQYAIAVDLENGVWYQKYKNVEGKEWQKKITLSDNKITYADCKTCLDEFTVIENIPTKLVLQVNPQDEGQFFVYQLEFTK